jgi:hypothetical protein
MNNPIFLILTGVFLIVASIFAYILFMIFLPEWVGITGKVAEEARKSHQGTELADDTFDANLEKWHGPKSSNESSDQS